MSVDNSSENSGNESSFPPEQEASPTTFPEVLNRLISKHVDKLRDLHELKYTSQEYKANLEMEISSILNGIIDILDSFDRMLQNIDSAIAQEDKQSRRILKNFSTIRKKFSVLLKKFEITGIAPESGEFVAGLHKAVALEASACIEEGDIIRTEKPGYFWNNRILRPAEVVVSSGIENREI